MRFFLKGDHLSHFIGEGVGHMGRRPGIEKAKVNPACPEGFEFLP